MLPSKVLILLCQLKASSSSWNWNCKLELESCKWHIRMNKENLGVLLLVLLHISYYQPTNQNQFDWLFAASGHWVDMVLTCNLNDVRIKTSVCEPSRIVLLPVLLDSQTTPWFRSDVNTILTSNHGVVWLSSSSIVVVVSSNWFKWKSCQRCKGTTWNQKKFSPSHRQAEANTLQCSHYYYS